MLKLLTRISALACVLFMSITIAGAQSAAQQADEMQMREWIKTLASDGFGGRKPMTQYEDVTVDYLAD